MNTKIPIRIDGIPTRTSAEKRMTLAERRPPNSLDVDGGEDADRDRDERRQQDHLDRPEDRGRRPSADPERPRRLGQEVDVQGAGAR